MQTGREKKTAFLATGLVTGFLAVSVFIVHAAYAAPLPARKPLMLAVASTIALPASKPSLEDLPPGQPDALRLLNFGKPPVPGHKPQHTASQATPQKKLGRDNAALYREIFAHQAHADWYKADALMAGLSDLRLRGHILAQRYLHPTAYRATFDELSSWLDLYADHPGADKIYRMANKRKPAGHINELREPARARSRSSILGVLDDGERLYSSPLKRTQSQRDQIAKLMDTLRLDISAGAPSKALKHLKSSGAVPFLDPAEYDRLLSWVAEGFLHEGKTGKALSLARDAAKRSGDKIPLAGWVGGLAAWREGNYKLSANLFETAARSPHNSDWMASASAFWTARAHMRAGKVREVNGWLEQAAAYPRTFYGLIATKTLGWEFDFNWDMPAYTAHQKSLISKIPAIQRADALIAAGQFHLAEQELRMVGANGDPAVREALLAYANDAALPSFALQVAGGMKRAGGGLYDAALYPLCPWEPREGYKVDRALIFALIRQESRFNPAAESPSGAAGLMQLMPATASYVAGSGKYKTGDGLHSLKNPQVNIDIGQRYVENLLRSAPVDNDLFALLAAYNAGPGNLAKWQRKLGNIKDDPLLFIESIPLSETRAFIERVMANYWIYRLRLDQPVPTLEAVAEGQPARYARLDDTHAPDTAGKRAQNEAPDTSFQVADSRGQN